MSTFKFLLPFIDATLEVFGGGTPGRLSHGKLESGEKHFECPGISSIVGFAGGDSQGTIIYSFNESDFDKLIQDLWPGATARSTADNLDRLTCACLKRVHTNLADWDVYLTFTPPVITRSKDLKLELHNIRHITVPFEGPWGKFKMECNLQPHDQDLHLSIPPGA